MNSTGLVPSRNRSTRAFAPTRAAANGFAGQIYRRIWARAATVVDGKLVVGGYSLSSDDIAQLMRTRAELDLRATGVPADGLYQAMLPPDFKMPAGLEFEVDTNDPAYVELAAFAKSRLDARRLLSRSFSGSRTSRT
jgi:hypothetical protein